MMNSPAQMIRPKPEIRNKESTRKFNTQYVGVVLFYLLAFFLVSIALFPYLWTFITSIKSVSELYTKTVTYFPKQITFENYVTLIQSTNFLGSMWNSLKVATYTTIVSLAVSTLAAYAFSRYNFPLKNLLRGSFVIIYMIPPVLILTPLFEIMKNLGMIGHSSSLVIAYASYTVPYAVWLLIGFLTDIPVALEESAMIDGSSRAGAFFRIILPLAAPGLIAAGIYCFIYAWNEFIYAAMFTSKVSRTLPVALNSFVGQYVIQWELLTAGGVLAGMPVAILFSFIQKKLVQGMTAGAVKG